MDRTLAAILSADVVGYAALMERDGNGEFAKRASGWVMQYAGRAFTSGGGMPDASRPGRKHCETFVWIWHNSEVLAAASDGRFALRTGTGKPACPAFVVHALVGPIRTSPELRCPSRPAIRAQIQTPSRLYSRSLRRQSRCPHVAPCGRSALWARQKSSIGGVKGALAGC
jgi:hypothetical protein